MADAVEMMAPICVVSKPYLSESVLLTRPKLYRPMYMVAYVTPSTSQLAVRRLRNASLCWGGVMASGAWATMGGGAYQHRPPERAASRGDYEAASSMATSHTSSPRSGERDSSASKRTPPRRSRSYVPGPRGSAALKSMLSIRYMSAMATPW